MPPATWLDVVPLWAVFAGALVFILASVEAGYRLGNRRRARSGQVIEGPVGEMVAADLGLLAFLLAFAFGIAAARFDERRRVLLDEANAIGTTFLRAGLLPEPRRSTIRRLLREYVDLRIAGVQERTLLEAIRGSEQLHVRLWDEATAVTEKDTRSIPAGLFVQSLNEVIDLHAKRVQIALRSRLPGTVWAVLFVIAALSFGAMGYHGGLSAKARSPAILVVALAFATTIWLVVDLERPHRGLLQVSQQPLIDLRDSMEAKDR